ncbi:MAG TPA: DUF2971 domain-containing protein [Candidatus Egerieousia sp.]|nr:DUF2971 domain-containing protein [Candidatus Egerieousia sp.]HPT05694.1 DUF2971 domain-containing protein [Candidatus Egerieousia sp.]
MKRPKILYHFTSIENIPGIIQEDKKIHLRATGIYYFNDPNEFTEGRKIHEKEFKKLNPQLKKNISGTLKSISKYVGEMYLTSFSESRDKLEMWNLYGKSGNGVALGFLTEKLEKPYSGYNVKFNKCVYDKKKFKSESDNFWQTHGKIDINDKQYSTNDTTTPADFPLSCVKYKTSAYKYEDEWRLCFLNNERCTFTGKTKYDVHNRISQRGVLVPFIDNIYPLEALQSITIGPSANYKQIKKTLNSYLESIIDKDLLKNIKIKKSRIKFRNI